MSLPIVRYNDPILRKKGAPVKVFDANLAALANEMVDTMHEANGIGLAAQQIGRALQLCVVDLRDAEINFRWEIDGARPPLELIMPMVIANPVITVARGTKELSYEEGCLSFPQIRGDVVRPDRISVKFQDERGVPHQLECDGLFARCIQHENDHLNGVLFIDRMEKKVRAEIDDAVKALAKDTRDAAKPTDSARSKAPK
jgi:peptide deformylase